MIIGGKEYSEIVITGKDNEVLAVISDNEIIEKDGVDVVFNKVDLSDPCSTCIHNPPSTFGGKPCCFCDTDDERTNCYEPFEDYKEEPIKPVIRLWVKDMTNGHVHEVGTDRHDSLLIRGGKVEYQNLQNGDGTPYGYKFCNAAGETELYLTDSPDVENIVLIGDRVYTWAEGRSDDLSAED